MQTLMQAIARQEGFYIPGSRACRNNNPGNLNFEKWQAEKFGAVLETVPDGEIARFAAFPNATLGFGALRALLSNAPYIGATLQDALNIYAPSSDDNNTSAYLHDVCEWTMFSPDTIITLENIG